MAFLLDANVLIALIDPAHVHSSVAHGWFANEGRHAWATCPITENAVLRIIGNPRYPNSPESPARVAPLLQGMCALPGHEFWPDEVSVLDAVALDLSRLLAVSQVTDTYLLALARARGGQLATLDRRLVTNAVPNGRTHLRLIS
jgi:toxin-antitoxin system PIN domain toxin